MQGTPPRLTSPSADATYALSGPAPTWKPLALRAETDGDAHKVFFFVDDIFAGRAQSGVPVFWQPHPGRFVVRAIDDRGRAASTALKVEVVQ